MALRRLNEFEARQYALLSVAGVPHQEIVRFFLPEMPPEELCQEALARWPLQAEVLNCIEEFNGGKWQDLTPAQRWDRALDKLYAEMAYFLWSHNYAELEGANRQKAETCATALERKIAGTAGQSSPLERAYEDILRAYNASKEPKRATH